MLEDDAANSVEGLMQRHEKLMRELEECKGMLDKAHAERDSLRDKDHHDPKMVHEPLSGEKSEEDEIGPQGKEEKDPTDTYGMQSHVKDYQKPSQMKEHVVSEPKNQHYPHDLPRIPNVDQAEFQRSVKARVRLEKLAERYLDKTSVSRMDSMSELDIKKKIILAVQKNAQLDGKSETYINARFDSVLEELPAKRLLQCLSVLTPTMLKTWRIQATHALR